MKPVSAHRMVTVVMLNEQRLEMAVEVDEVAVFSIRIFLFIIFP